MDYLAKLKKRPGPQLILCGDLKTNGLKGHIPSKSISYNSMWDETLKVGFVPEELGHYDASSISKFIEKGFDAVDPTRDGYVQQIQISEVSPRDLNNICQQNMRLSNETRN